jgi:hypothetical protein
MPATLPPLGAFSTAFVIVSSVVSLVLGVLVLGVLVSGVLVVEGVVVVVVEGVVVVVVEGVVVVVEGVVVVVEGVVVVVLGLVVVLRVVVPVVVVEAFKAAEFLLKVTPTGTAIAIIRRTSATRTSTFFFVMLPE